MSTLKETKTQTSQRDTPSLQSIRHSLERTKSDCFDLLESEWGTKATNLRKMLVTRAMVQIQHAIENLT